MKISPYFYVVFLSEVKDKSVLFLHFYLFFLHFNMYTINSCISTKILSRVYVQIHSVTVHVHSNVQTHFRQGPKPLHF